MISKKLIIFLLSILLFSFSAFAQEQDIEHTPISVAEIQRGLHDLNYIRLVLLERGFELESQKGEPEHLHEYWKIKGVSSPFEVIVFQINAGSSKYIKYANFYYSVRKDLFPSYASIVKSDILTSFPLKRVQDIEETTTKGGEETTKKTYKLVYYKSGSIIEAGITTEEKWARFHYEFLLHYPAAGNTGSVKKPRTNGTKEGSVKANIGKSK